MAKSKSTKGKAPKKAAKKPAAKKSPAKKSAARKTDIFKLRDNKVTTEEKERVHVLRKGIICLTEPRGHATPENKSPLEIVLDASNGFIPLWAKNTTLNWRFNERSLMQFEDPDAVREYVRDLFGKALLAWDTAVPVKFSDDEDVWDFEIVINGADDCIGSGCVLASAFFPDAGRHELVIYPKMFTQSDEEQIETMVHEIGHVFGLRHFFADVQESQFPSVIFGKHSKFSIMNYGNLSKLTSADKKDLQRLYEQVWAGKITEINGTPIRLVSPFHTLARPLEAILPLQAAAMQ